MDASNSDLCLLFVFGLSSKFVIGSGFQERSDFEEIVVTSKLFRIIFAEKQASKLSSA